MENPQFLKKKYSDLHKSPEVLSAKKRTNARRAREVSDGKEVEKVSQKPEALSSGRLQ